MRELENFKSAVRNVQRAIREFSLDLSGMRVLTEAATGPFVVTPLIAALAGADEVVAVTRDSPYGTAVQVADYTMRLASELGIDRRVRVSFASPVEEASNANIVTNLGFVRPISEELIMRLPADVAVPLMWETWEFRPEDLDLQACRARNIPVLGTNEHDSRLQIFRYLGPVVLKLLLSSGVEVFRSRILLVGSGEFGDEVFNSLCANGAIVQRVPSDAYARLKSESILNFARDADAVVLVEHRDRRTLVGADGLPVNLLAEAGVPVVHVCGNVGDDEMSEAGVRKIPPRRVKPGYMTVTTDFVGARPVIDLHTAGLKVGEAMVTGMRRFGDAEKAMEFAMRNSPAMGW